MPSDFDLPRLIPLSARTVLDVGCGRGALGAAFRVLNPNARLLAIDRDPDRVDEARVHYDACLTADAAMPELPFDAPGGIDCIVYHGVLEHLSDPFAVLRRHAALLSPDGMMIIRMANARHWRRASHILRGGDAALFRTAGFDPDGVRDNLTAAGLLPVDARPAQTDDPEGRDFVAAMAPSLSNLGIDPADYARAALPLHFTWRVRRTPIRRLVVAGDMLRPIGGVSHLRVVHPLHAISTDPAVVTQLASSNSPPDIEDVPRIFVLHRPALFGTEGQRVVNNLIDRGWLVVTEFDDHPDFLPGLNNPSLISFRGVHAVQTSTPTLAAILRQRNPETMLFPNAIATLPPVRNFTDPRYLTVFFGALNREADWPKHMDAINAVAALVGPRLRFRVVHDEGFFQALRTPYKRFTPLCDYDTYMNLLGTSEICLMPLDDTPFNRAKSDLKFIEAGACRVASLASHVVYADSIAHGETGLIFRDPGEFHRLFLRLAMEPDLALTLGNEARRMVTRHRMLADQVAPRIAWYRDLWDRRDELTAALRGRIDGLPLPA